MNQLNSSGLAGITASPFAAVMSIGTPGTVPQHSAHKPLIKSVSFVDLLNSTPISDMSPAAPEHDETVQQSHTMTVAELPDVELPISELPGGKTLPVADSLPFTFSLPTPIGGVEVELEPELDPELVSGPPPLTDNQRASTHLDDLAVLTKDNAGLLPPRTDRLMTAAGGKLPHGVSPIAFNGEGAPSPTPMPAPDAPDAPDAQAARQISTLAVAAAQMLSAAKPQPAPQSPQQTAAPPTIAAIPADAANFDISAQPRGGSDASGQQSQQAPTPTPTTTNQPIAATETGTGTPASGSSPAPAQTTQDIKSANQPLVRPEQHVDAESLAERVANAAETARPNSAKIHMPHEQFGQVRMQLELAGAGLKVTLGNNDPGFTTAVQAALADRAVMAESIRGDVRSEASPQQQNQPQSQNQQGNASHSAGGTAQGQNASNSGELGRGNPAFTEPRDSHSNSPADNADEQPSDHRAGLFA